MRTSTATLLLLSLLSVVTPQTVDLATAGQTGVPLNQMTCNVQTIIDFRFNSSSIVTAPGAINFSVNNLGFSNLTFLDRYGSELVLPLTAISYDNSTATTGFVTGYNPNFTINAAVIMQFSSGVNNVYVYIPFVSAPDSANPDIVDLTSGVVSNSLFNWGNTASMAPFNFFDTTDYNQWYTAVSGTNTVLISNFIYVVSSTTIGAADTAQSVPATTLTALNFPVGTTGDKLCYASPSYGNFQTQLREVVAFWFVWFLALIYWLIHLFSEATNPAVYNREKYADNKITCWSLYSITQMAHEEFFTRLSRLTVVLLQWTIQGVFIAAIISSAYSTGPAVFFWSALLSVIITLPFPFLFGHIFLHKIYKRSLLKYVTKKKMAESTDKTKQEEYEARIDTCDEKLFGYYHWFYAVAFMLFWTCWPITINRMQTLPRTAYEYSWYWLAAMMIAFILEFFVVEPIMIAIWGHTNAVKRRGGFWYDTHLGEAYRQTNQV